MRMLGEWRAAHVTSEASAVNASSVVAHTMRHAHCHAESRDAIIAARHAQRVIERAMRRA
jgi:hypothetical protein